MSEVAVFACSICSEPSTDICLWCTKDTCGNHRCLRCLRCSDCCECEVPLTPQELHPAPIVAVLPEEPAGIQTEAPSDAHLQELPPELP